MTSLIYDLAYQISTYLTLHYIIRSRDVTKFEFEHWRISNNFTAIDKCWNCL